MLPGGQVEEGALLHALRRELAEETGLQAAYHATEHRQQIATMLTNIGVEPPEPDFWAYWNSIQSTR